MKHLLVVFIGPSILLVVGLLYFAAKWRVSGFMPMSALVNLMPVSSFRMHLPMQIQNLNALMTVAWDFDIYRE